MKKSLNIKVFWQSKKGKADGAKNEGKGTGIEGYRKLLPTIKHYKRAAFPVQACRYILYVVVQFYPWFNFYFALFLCMVMKETNLRKIKIEPRIKLNHNIYMERTSLTKGSTFFANEGFIACQRRKLLELKIRYCIDGRTVHMTCVTVVTIRFKLSCLNIPQAPTFKLIII